MFQALEDNGYVIDEDFFDPYGSCRGGGSVPACNAQDCYHFWVECDMMSNELFDTDGAVPLEEIEKREWCGSAAQYAGETGGSGDSGDVEAPAGSLLHVDLSPTETSVLVDWTSRTWGSNSLSGNGTGYAEYRFEPCPSGTGDCVLLRKLVVYGGDIEVNGVEVTNMIAQLIRPIWLQYDTSFGVDIYPRDLIMLLTYKLGNDRVAWQISNSSTSEGRIDPLTDAFVLNALEFSGSQGDISVSVELDVGGSHQ